MPFLTGIINLVTTRTEEHTGCVQQFGYRKNEHQYEHQAQVNEQYRVGRQGLPVELNQAKRERLQGNDIGMHNVLHHQAARGYADKQHQHQVIGRPRNIADTLNQEASTPQREQTGEHGKTGVFPKRLNQAHPGPDGLGEIPEVAQNDQQHRDMEDPAKQPGPLVGFEQAFKEGHFPEHTQNHALACHRGGCCGDFKRGWRACVEPDSIHQADNKNCCRQVK